MDVRELKLAELMMAEPIMRRPPPPGTRFRREVAQGRRDVVNPAWRAWAKLKPLTT